MKWLIILSSFGMLSAVSVAQPGKVETALQVLLSAPEVKHATLGIEVHNLSTSRPVASYQQHIAVAPASTMKLPVTAAALDLLGSDYQFETILAYRGDLADDVLLGDLVIVGGGDPALASRHFGVGLDAIIDQWIQSLKSAGIREIRGDIVVDNSRYEINGASGSWQYQDIGNYYGAGPHSLNIADNLYTVNFQQSPSIKGQTSIASINPPLANLSIDNQVVSGPKGSGDNAYIYGAPFQSNVIIRGTIPAGTGIFSIKGSMPDPPQFAADLLFSNLELVGIRSTGIPRTTNKKMDGLTLILRLSSPTLSSIASVSNRVSVNLFTESMGSELLRLHPDFNLEHYWETKGIETGGVHFDDFSGLSKNSTVTASFMSGVLQSIYNDTKLYQELKPGLSVAGKTGTMRNMLRNSEARGKVFGKSGSISGVRAYIGYMETSTGEVWSFSLLSQNFTGSSRRMSRLFENFLDAVYHAAKS